MMHKTFIFMPVIILQTITAAAATCEPGYYPQDGVCTICPAHHACPDGNSLIRCSSISPAQYTNGTGATECIDCPTNINDPTGFLLIQTTNSPRGATSDCRAHWQRNTPHGGMHFSCYYSNGAYDAGSTNQKCMIDVTKCDAGFVPIFDWIEASGNYRIWRDSYAKIPTEVCRPVGIGNYSADNERVATACPIGTSTHTDTAASIDECIPLCKSNSRLHVGEYKFNLWRDKTTTPSLNIRTADGDICYINLTAGPGTLNIRYNDSTIYHATN